MPGSHGGSRLPQEPGAGPPSLSRTPGAHPPGAVRGGWAQVGRVERGKRQWESAGGQDPRARPVSAGCPQARHFRLRVREWGPGGESRPNADPTRGLRREFLSIGFSRRLARKGRNLGLFLEAARTVKREGQNTSLANLLEAELSHRRI